MRALLKKLGIIAAVLLVSAMVLMRLELLVWERNHARQDAVNDIAASWAGPQQLAGPLLVVPYKVEIQQKSTVRNATGQPETVVEREIVERRLVETPDRTAVVGELVPSVRSRGIYTVNTYTTALEATGQFVVTPPVEGRLFRGERVVQVDAPQLVVAVRGTRGIEGAPVLTAGGTPLSLTPGLVESRHVFDAGFHAALPAGTLTRPHDGQEQPVLLPFTLTMRLRGTQSLLFIPLGRDYGVQLASPWPHPKFTGGFLPAERAVGQQGFSADWQVTELAMGSDAANPTAGWNKANAFGVELYDPVDIYQQTTRAVKYGLMFILLTFVCFFLVEVLAGPPVHFMQYLLVACVLAMFFLLLLSLSEHLGFAMAYAIAGAACVTLFGFYARHVLHSRRRGLCFGLGLALLYGVLYVILQSEDTALLLGSGLLFLALAATLYVTRNVDWRQLGKGSEFVLENG